MKEIAKSPCCEKCGQSLPTPPPLTVKEKIADLRAYLKSTIGFGSTTRVALNKILDVLEDLESRQPFTFTNLPPVGTVPWNPSPMIYPPVNPLPTTGDPISPPSYTISCSTGEVDSVESVGDATGYSMS